MKMEQRRNGRILAVSVLDLTAARGDIMALSGRVDDLTKQ